MVKEFDDFTRKYSNHHDNRADDYEKHCSTHDFDGLPCQSVEGVLNSLFQLGDHLEVLFEEELIDSGGTFVVAFDNILIWVDHEANVNITDLSGPISVRKMGTKRKKKQKHKEKNNSNHKCDNQNDKKKRDKAEKKVKGSRKKDVKNDQSDVNEELLNFVKLEKEEQETEIGSQENLTLPELHKDTKTTEEESFPVEDLDSTGEGDDSLHDSFDENEVGIHLYIEKSSYDSDSEEEHNPPLESKEVQFEENELDQGMEEKSLENENGLQEVLKDELDTITSGEHLASEIIDVEGTEILEDFESQEETLFVVEDPSAEEDLNHSPINKPPKNDKQ